MLETESPYYQQQHDSLYRNGKIVNKYKTREMFNVIIIIKATRKYTPAAKKKLFHVLNNISKNTQTQSISIVKVYK